MKKLLIAAVALCLALFTPAAAFAEEYNYDVHDAEWEDCSDSEGRIYGIWTEADDPTSYSVELYKGSKLIYRKTVSGCRINLSQAIAGKTGGSGTYSFVVVPTKDGKSSESEDLKVTSSMVSLLKKQVTADNKAEIISNGTGWVSGPNDIWVYYDQSGTQLKSQWVTDSGYKYYLDKNGQMVTGWQTIGSAWYYFETQKGASRPRGALYVDCVTPDGYTVNADGAWFDPAKTSGTAAKGSGAGSASGSGSASAAVTAAKSLSSVSITLQEDTAAGSYSRIREITSGSGTVSNVTYKTDPSGWTSSSPGSVVFDLTVSNGYALNGKTKFSCSRASSVSVLSVSDQTARIELHYIPKYVLAKPTGFYVTDDRILRWMPVPKAASYTVKVTYSYETDEGDTKKKTASVSVTEPVFNPSNHGIAEDMTLTSMTVTAVGSSKKTFTNSSAVSVDFAALAENPVDGEFQYSSSGMSFRNGIGEQVTGWKQLLGNWYYFKKNGYAAGPGWYQDTDGNWYYFDSAYRMMTGTINDNGTDYFLNDGSNSSFPKGAWVH